jgi:hypothetical protein
MDAKDPQQADLHRNWGRAAAQASLITAIFAWLVGQAFKGPHSSPAMEQARIVAELVRGGLYVGGTLCALLGLFAIRKFGRQGILGAASFGVFLNLGYLYIVGWSSASTLYARQATTTAKQQTATPTSSVAQLNGPRFIIDYDALEFHKLELAHERAAQALTRQNGEDAAVLQAWIATVREWTNMVGKVRKAEQAVAKAAVLNPATITSRKDFTTRRQLANAWYTAVNDWQNELHEMRSRYSRNLIEQRVSDQRRALEVQRLLVATPGGVKIAVAHCAGQKEVATQINFALTALETEHAYWSVRQSKRAGTFQVRPNSEFWDEPMKRLASAVEALKQLRQELGLPEPLFKVPAAPQPQKPGEVVL